MDRMKTFLKYAIMFVAFYLFSNFLIFVGLNSSYDNIKPKAEIISQVDIQRAEATLVNGRIKGNIKNIQEDNLVGKFLRVDLYSPNKVLLGSKYIEIKPDPTNPSMQEFRIYFKLQDVEYYDISITDKVEEVATEPFLDQVMEKREIIFATVFTMLMLI